MAQLNGDSTEHDLGNGVRIAAPGVQGIAELQTTTIPLASPTGQLFDHALGNSGLSRRPPIVISHTTPASGEVTVTFPAPAADSNSVLLVHDSTGAASWHFPDQPTAAVAAFKAQSPGPGPAVDAPTPSELAFTLPVERFAAGHLHASLLSRLAGLLHHFTYQPAVDGGAAKILSVLDYPVTHLGAWGATSWIDHWDRNKHPSVIRWFPPTGGQGIGEALSPTNWATLDRANGPVLLFIHGIFSTCNGAFGAIGQDPDTWASLRKAYAGRIIAYDHPTVSVGPEANAQEFLAQIPDGVTLDIDIVCHSRGGLVARALAGQSPTTHDASTKLNVRKIIFAATPNGGSQIAIPSNWGTLVNRISSVLTLPSRVLPAPVDEVTSILAGILEIMKVIAVDTAVELPGLEDMKPGSELLTRLGAFGGTTPQYFAAASDFEPGPVLANLFHSIDDIGRVVDLAVFPDVHNDIAVPTNGVWDPANPNGATNSPTPAPVIPGFPIPGERRIPIGPTSVYWHSAYFEDPAMRNALVEWLTPAS